jgi:predicted ester cyclase
MFPNIESQAERFYHDGDVAVVEVRSIGTHQGTFEGVGPNGKAIDVWSLGIFTFDGDRIISEKVCSNDLLLLRQISDG